MTMPTRQTTDLWQTSDAGRKADRSRFLRALFGRLEREEAHKSRRRADLLKDGPADISDMKLQPRSLRERHTPNWDRWAEITANVQKRFYELEEDFGPLRDSDETPPICGLYPKNRTQTAVRFP